jgi:hypothetical protein
MVGAARQTQGQKPINGLRYQPDGESNGWFVWAGEWSDADDFFQPLHIEHFGDYFPSAYPYLDLPPGYRFVIDNEGYEDVWFDENLIRKDA